VFYDANRADITLCNAAKRYFDEQGFKGKFPSINSSVPISCVFAPMLCQFYWMRFLGVNARWILAAFLDPHGNQ
jgi:hypothetical protein